MNEENFPLKIDPATEDVAKLFLIKDENKKIPHEGLKNQTELFKMKPNKNSKKLGTNEASFC